MTAAGLARVIAVGALALVATATATAEPLAAVARARVEASLPAALTLAEVHLTARLAALDVDPATVTITWSRAPRVGTASVRLRWGGRQTRFVPVTLVAPAPPPAGASALAAELTAGTPPLARGTAVTIEVRRGAVRVTGPGTLERDARVGEDALVRLQHDRPPLRGTLVAADRVVIGLVTP